MPLDVLKGLRWSSVRTLSESVAPLWCDLGCRSRAVVIIKAAAKTCLTVTVTGGSPGSGLGRAPTWVAGVALSVQCRTRRATLTVTGCNYGSGSLSLSCSEHNHDCSGTGREFFARLRDGDVPKWSITAYLVQAPLRHVHLT